MIRFIVVSVLIGAFLTASTTSCDPPRQAVSIISITPEVFEQLTISEVFLGYVGSGRVSDVADLGASHLDISLDRVSFNISLDYVTVTGQTVGEFTREGFHGVDVIIGNLEYLNGKPYRILPKRWVVSGDNGAFIIDSKIKAGDRLFVACLGYVVKVYDISKLIDSPQRRMP